MQALFEHLTTNRTDDTLYDRLGGRIYFEQAPQEIPDGNGRMNPTPFPYLVFDLANTPVERFHGEVETQNGSVQFALFGARDDGPFELSKIHEEMIALLDGAEFAVGDHDRGLLLLEDRGQPATEEDAIVVLSTWTLTATHFTPN